MNQLKKVTRQEVIDSITIWGGYMETPVSCGLIGDQWIADLGKHKSLKAWLKTNEDVVAELLEQAGYQMED